MRVYGLIGLGLILFSSSFGCTRKVESHPLRISIPIEQQKAGILANVYDLQVAIANVQIPGRPPILAQIDTHGPNAEDIPLGRTLTFPPIENVPNGVNIFVQVLTVYGGSEQGDLKFYYGDRAANISGETVLDVTVNPSGTSTGKEANIIGRYLTSPTAGPTGTLAIQFEVGGGKPNMTIERKAIVNGWFEAFAVSGAKFDVVVEESQFKIFDDLTVTAGGLVEHSVGGVPTNFSYTPSRLAMKKPLHYRREYQSPDVEPQPETLLILGYFDGVNDSHVNATSRQVHFPNVTEGIPNAFTDLNLTVIQNYVATGGSGSDVTQSAGGVSSPFQDMYTMTATGCNEAQFNAGNCMLFYHAKMGFDGRDGYSGIRIPFRVMDPFSPHGGYVKSKYKNSGCVGASPCIVMDWNLLPGTGPVLSEIEIWKKYSNSGGGGGGGGDRTCADLVSEGYSLAGTAPGTSNSFEFAEAGMSTSNFYNYSFNVCAKINTAAGPKYLGRPMWVDSASCFGGCGDFNHLGWAVSGTSNVPTNTPHSGFSKVTGGIVVTNPHYSQVDVASTTPFSVGDEVMIHVSAQGNNGDCGTYSYGGGIGPGSYSFARILAIPTSSTLKLTKGSLLEPLAPVSPGNFSGSSGTFCTVQVVKVLHYNNLTLATTAGLEATPFSFTSGGGILPVRVSGALSMGGGSYIRANGAGFPGGIPSSHGAGFEADSSPSGPASNAGRVGIGTINPNGGGGGGGGYGRGGNATPTVEGGSGWTGNNGSIRALFGGGGGGADPFFTGQSGAAGGGIVLVFAKEINAAASFSNAISADGASTTGSSIGGGGGGGSAFVYTRKLSGTAGSTVLTVSANGGNSFFNGSQQGGIGGGGWVGNLICQNALNTPANLVFEKAKGSLGADVPNGGMIAGDGIISALSSSQYSYLCQ